MPEKPIIVVGAGQAGLQVVDSVRRGGYAGPLCLIAEENELPYQRPPLSKQYLLDDMADARLLFRPADYYEKQGVEVLQETRATALDLAQRSLGLSDGSTRGFEKLALTTGASVRALPVPGADLDGVCYLRTLDDARYIRAALERSNQRVAAIGGGFIGLEVAASARQRGHEVTVIEAQDRLMARVVSPLISSYFLDLHRGRGVNVMLNAGVTKISRASEGLILSLANGDDVAADLVLVGIGSVPNCEVAAAAGIHCDNGIVVDEFARTSDPNVVAAGDCTSHRNVRYTGHQRLESVQNAVDQAKIAAQTLLGGAKAYDQVPWFWSDQYDAKLQMTGSCLNYDRFVVRGEPAAGAFSAFYFSGNVLLGVDSINRPADHLVSRKLLAENVSVPEDMIIDVEQNLKTLL